MRRLAIGGLGALLLMACGSPARAAAVRVGERCPNVTLSDWQGQAVTLASQPGQVMVIDFWASWCEPCRAALPRLDAIARERAGKPLHVFAVNVDKTAAKADAFRAAHLAEPSLTVLRDPNGAVLARFGAAGMPALYVVDQDGVVRLVESGFTVEGLRSVEELIDALLSGSAPP